MDQSGPDPGLPNATFEKPTVLHTGNQRAAICGNFSRTPIWARIGHIRPEWQVTGAAEHRACCKGRTGSAVLLRRRAEAPVRRDLGPWRVLRRRGGLTNDREPQADAEERIRSAHRAIEIREKRRRVLSSLCLDLPCAPADVERERRAGHRARHRLVERRTPLSARHRWSWARHITTYRTADLARWPRPGVVTLCDWRSGVRAHPPCRLGAGANSFAGGLSLAQICRFCEARLSRFSWLSLRAFLV